MMGRVIHTGQVVIDLTLRIEAIPEPGGDVFADESSMAVGGGFNVLAAARRMGVERGPSPRRPCGPWRRSGWIMSARSQPATRATAWP